MIVPRYYENLKVLHENTMPNRCYYIPSSQKVHTYVHDREESDRFQLLNDQWKFRYYDSIYDLQEEFYADGFDVSDYDSIAVPGVWQNAGFCFLQCDCGYVLHGLYMTHGNAVMPIIFHSSHGTNLFSNIGSG